MPLTPGDRFGAYDVVSALGVGGMGEVYRASDSRLKRHVAIKVLPAGFAADRERVARFQREAELLAAVNHPNIAAIYGIEESGGVTGLVMELVEGSTLADLIAAGAIPTTDAIAIAKQIAAALEAAHESGIIHRDLKPANVKVASDGTVKVLDFGLAKNVEAIASDTLNSPTITSPAMTMRGVVLGTAAYMAPEQARGRTVDRRADIWAFGVVLYEMLTGKRPFEGEDVSLTLAEVMKSDPDFVRLPADLSPSIRVCLHRCLQKDPRQRIRDIGDVRLMLDGAFESSAPVRTEAAPAHTTPSWRRGLPAAAAAILSGVAVGIAMWRMTPSDPRPVTRFEHVLQSEVNLRSGSRRTFAASPDGQRLVYSAMDGIYLHVLDQLEDRQLFNTTLGVANLVFSPDGESIAFHHGGQLKRLALAGGTPIVVTPSTSFNPVGMAWTEDEHLLYAIQDGIQRIAAQGGTPELVFKAGDGELLSNPQVLPGGEYVLLTVSRNLVASGGDGLSRQGESDVAAYSLRSSERHTLVRGATDAKYLASGHIVYTVGDGLFAVAFDRKTMQTTGSPVSLVERIQRGSGPTSVSLADYDVTSSGNLFYIGLGNNAAGDPLTWVDRAGRTEIVKAVPPMAFLTPRLSADQQRVLVVAQGDLRIYDLATGRETRITSDRNTGAYSEFLPGERAVVYSSSRQTEGGLMNIWLQPLDGSGRATQLTKVPGQLHVDALSPDGRVLAAHHHKGNGPTDVLIMPMSDGAAGEAKPFVAGDASKDGGVFSPDGRYFAYLDGVSGRMELVIRPFPGPGPETTVSVGGAREPAWAKNGELFYRRLSDDMMMAVKVSTAPTLHVGPPEELFRGNGQVAASPRATYAVTADGKRFLMSGARVLSAARDGRGTHRINVVVNWIEEVKRRVPHN